MVDKRFIIKIFISLYLFCGIGLTASAKDSEEALQISEFAWTSGIDPKTKNPIEIYTEIAPKNRPLYLWMKIKGGKTALAELRRGGKLPIRHKWFRYIGTRPYFDSTKEPTDTIDLLVGKHEVLSELNAELDNQGFFEWRVWSGKQEADVRMGWWRVDVVYADNEPVLCGKDPCVYNILIKE